MDEIRIGIVGLGRLGSRHALNLHYKTVGCRVAAACSLLPQELDWAREHLELPSEALYEDFEKMAVREDLDALFVVSSTSEHRKHIEIGLSAGKHLFCEKPVAINVPDCQAVEELVRRHPNQVFMIGFVRRFDPSYVEAKAAIDRGLIGRPFCVRSQTADMDETAAFQVAFTEKSGGIFLDMNVHDIDLARWYLGAEVQSVYAIGGSYVHKEFEALGDGDNTSAVCSFDNGSMAYFACSRTAMHGHDSRTEIMGSEGNLYIGRTPWKTRVTVADKHGERVECVRDFFTRFEDAFQIEVQSFIDCIRKGTRPEITALDGTKATEVALALTRSYREKQVVSL